MPGDKKDFMSRARACIQSHNYLKQSKKRRKDGGLSSEEDNLNPMLSCDSSNKLFIDNLPQERFSVESIPALNIRGSPAK